MASGTGVLIALAVGGFVVFFVLLWLGVTALLGWLSGWAKIQATFPDRPEVALASLSMQSARMGVGVSFNHCLRLDVCPSGLRIVVPAVLAPGRKPLLVPWQAIRVEEASVLGLTRYRLRFGSGRDEVILSKSSLDAIARSSPLRAPQR